MNSYRLVSEFGPNSYSDVNNPLSYCLNDTMDQRFLHGSHADTLGQHSKSCQMFLSDYCSKNWDQFCEFASQNTSKMYPYHGENCSLPTSIGCNNLTAGESLIRNTASRKYLVKMLNCNKVYEPFDPTVATSPMISYWVPNKCSYTSACTPVYEVDAKTIDNDIVMDKILQKPEIALNILINIFNTMKRKGNLNTLKNTKLGLFYSLHPYFKNKF